MLTLAIKLILAHAIGDFLFQPTNWVIHKETHKHKSKFLYWHILIHTMALMVILQFNFKYWLAIAIIPVSHYIIDVVKLHLKSKINNRLLFGLDQLAHLIVIALVIKIYQPYTIQNRPAFCSKNTTVFNMFIRYYRDIFHNHENHHIKMGFIRI